MEFFEAILKFLGTKCEYPVAYGWYHLLCLALMVIATVVLCLLWKKGVIKNVSNVVLVTAIIVGILEIYKQIIFSFSFGDSTEFSYYWNIFPWQFCSTPLFVGLAAGLTKGKVHHHLTAYLATYAFFAGLAVMLYPGDVFLFLVGINIQTMVCHGSMVVIAIFLYYTGYVKLNRETIFKAIPVFLLNVGIALTLNEVAYLIGITENHVFNMFFFSPHFDSTLPVYSWVHNTLRGNIIGFIFSIIIYILGFTLCAFVMLLIPMGIKKLLEYDFDSYYAEKDRIAAEKKALRDEQRRLEEEQMMAEARERAEQRKKEIEAKKEELRQKKEEMRKKAEERREKREEKLSEEKRKARKERRERAEKKKEERKEKAKKAKQDKKAKKLQKKEDKKRRSEEKKRRKEAEKRELLGRKLYDKKEKEKEEEKRRKQEKKEKKEKLKEEKKQKEQQKYIYKGEFEVVSVFDENQNGKIDKKELREIEKYDQDRDGFINKKEAKKIK